jgi:hypothetical protein
MRTLLERLDSLGDRLSPIVIKEVRQFVRSREFLASFATSLVVALLIAFMGSSQAVTGSRIAGVSTFSTLTVCLGLLGLVVVPLGAFTTLRTERLEQTLDLISLTTMSPRRIVVGKLGAQGVKLVTFFAVMMPFVATSFLLGGIDFVTILVSMLAVFLASMWVAAAALFISTMFQSRLMSGIALAVIAFVLFVLYMVSRTLILMLRYGVPFVGLRVAYASAGQWVQFAAMIVFCVTTMANLVLLAESRLTLPTENRVSALRVGLFVQFLLIVVWALGSARLPIAVRPSTFDDFVFFGGLHLAAVAAFAVTEGLTGQNPRVASPAWLRRWSWLLPVFGPGSGRAALYMLLQMAVFIATGAAITMDGPEVTRLFALCGAICLLSGVPTLVVHRFADRGLGPLHARGLLLVLLLLSLVLPDIVYYLVWRPEAFTLTFDARHLFSPVLPIFNWDEVSPNVARELAPIAWAVLGVVSYLGIIAMSRDDGPQVQPASPGLALEGVIGDGDSR